MMSNHFGETMKRHVADGAPAPLKYPIKYTLHPMVITICVYKVNCLAKYLM